MTPSIPLVDFVKGGNSTFTLKSKNTGKHFTFRAKKKEAGPVFVSVLTGTGFEFLGVIDESGYRTGFKSKFKADSCQATAFSWFWRNAASLPPTCEFHHEGRCCRCGRRLTDPESLAKGIGRECESLSYSKH